MVASRRHWIALVCLVTLGGCGQEDAAPPVQQTAAAPAPVQPPPASPPVEPPRSVAAPTGPGEPLYDDDLNATAAEPPEAIDVTLGPDDAEALIGQVLQATAARDFQKAEEALGALDHLAELLPDPVQKRIRSARSTLYVDMGIIKSCP